MCVFKSFALVAMNHEIFAVNVETGSIVTKVSWSVGPHPVGWLEVSLFSHHLLAVSKAGFVYFSLMPLQKKGRNADAKAMATIKKICKELSVTLPEDIEDNDFGVPHYAMSKVLTSPKHGVTLDMVADADILVMDMQLQHFVCSRDDADGGTTIKVFYIPRD